MNRIDCLDKSVEAKLRYIVHLKPVFFLVWVLGGLLGFAILVSKADGRLQALLIPHLSVCCIFTIAILTLGYRALSTRRALHALMVIWGTVLILVWHFYVFSFFFFSQASVFGDASLSSLVLGVGAVSGCLMVLVGAAFRERMWSKYKKAGAIRVRKAVVDWRKEPQAGGSPLWGAIMPVAAALGAVLGTFASRWAGENFSMVMAGFVMLGGGLFMIGGLAPRFGLLVKIWQWERSSGKILKF